MEAQHRQDTFRFHGLENIFASTARFNALVALVDGTSTNYMRSNSTSGAQLPVIAGAPGTPPQGAIWYDSTDSKLKYYTGSSTVTVGTGGGSVTSVNLSAPSEFSVSGGPVNTSGTLGLAWASQAANKVLASPDGAAGLPSFRTLVQADIPNMDWSKITSGKPTTISGYGITDGIQNAGNTPSLQSGLDAGKPAAGTVGRIFIAYDTGKIYRDSGATWDLVANTYSAPTGTTNHIVKFTGASTMGDSLIVDDGSRITVTSDVVSTPGTVNTGGTIDLRTSNTHLLKSVGGSVLTLQNLAHGGLYNIIINDSTSRTYTFSGCTNSYFKPANGPTTAGTQSVYGLLVYNDGGNWNCYITWSTGFQ